MKRRAFLAALAAIPFVRRFVPAPAPLVINVGDDVFMFERGMLVGIGGPPMKVAAVDYEKRTITMEAFAGKGWQYL